MYSLLRLLMQPIAHAGQAELGSVSAREMGARKARNFTYLHFGGRSLKIS